MASVPSDLVDGYGRVHRDLRISVTDRCNFRCQYCMPEEGMEWLDRSQVLTFEEITRVATLMVKRFAITSIRLTGGEPTVRARLPRLVSKLSRLDVDLALTTNGAMLQHQAPDLAAAGLKRINVSLDSLQRDRFIELTRRDELDAVLAGIKAASAAGLDPVKVNCVLMAGINDDEIVDFATFGRETGVSVRFIEFMPLDADDRWNASLVVSRDTVLAALRSEFDLEPVTRGHDPAERFRYLDGRGDIGIIATVTTPFCSDCDRVRLTATGALQNCLFATTSTDLRDPMRAGASDDDLADLIQSCVAAKGPGHQIGRETFVAPPRSMSQVGG